MSTTSELCHIAIQTPGGEVDLTLAADIPLTALLPTAFDIITETGLLPDDLLGQHLAFAAVGSGPLNSRKSLTENGIQNGDLLTVVRLADRPTPPVFGRAAAIRNNALTAIHPNSVTSTAPMSVWAGSVLTTLLASLLIFLLLQPYSPSHLAIGGICCALTIAAAALTRRLGLAPQASCVAGIASIVMIGFTSALALPVRSVWSSFLLFMATCGVSSMGASRLLRCGTRIFGAVTGVSAVASAAVLGAMLRWWTAQAIGPLLVLISVILLVSAPRIALHSMINSMLQSPDIEVPTLTALDGQPRLFETVDNRLTTLIAIAAALAGIGAFFIITTAPPTPISIGAAVLANVSLVLHAQRYRDIPRHATLATSALISGVSVVWSMAIAYPATVPWLCAGVLAASGLIYLSYQSLSDGFRRALENIVTATAIPLSCWAGGLFSAVRGLSFA